jgi:ABC-type nitrate/sulfonate/bicarbonate transport system substrate-binding protein
MASGEAAAGSIPPENWPEAQRRGYNRLFSYDEFRREQGRGEEGTERGIVTSGKLLRERPDVAVRFLRAVAQGLEQAKNRDAALAVLTSKDYFGYSAEGAAASYDYYLPGTILRVDVAGKHDGAWVREMQAFFLNKSPDQLPPLDAMVDPTPLQKALSK